MKAVPKGKQRDTIIYFCQRLGQHHMLWRNVSGYVCNHGSPSGERDTASPRGRYGERLQRFFFWTQNIWDKGSGMLVDDPLGEGSHASSTNTESDLSQSSGERRTHSSE